MADQRRENVRREEAARAADEANRAAKAATQAKTPGQSSLTEQRLKSAFRAVNAKQWMRADATLNDILKTEPDNEEALRGKRLVAAHRTEDLPVETPAPVEPIRVAEPAPAPQPTRRGSVSRRRRLARPWILRTSRTTLKHGGNSVSDLFRKRV